MVVFLFLFFSVFLFGLQTKNVVRRRIPSCLTLDLTFMDSTDFLGNGSIYEFQGKLKSFDFVAFLDD